MSLATHTAGGIAVATFALPALGFAVGSAVFDRPPVRWEAVGSPDDFPDDTYLPRVITTTPGIGEVGKTTVYVRAFNPDIDGKKDPNIPFADEQGGDFVAISTRCMHLGCPVRFVAAAERFICPCHGGVYDFTGRVDGGPPVRPLDRFYTRVVGNPRQVGPRFSVNQELERFSPRDPGEPLAGVGQYMYPSRPTVRKLSGT